MALRNFGGATLSFGAALMLIGLLCACAASHSSLPTVSADGVAPNSKTRRIASPSTVADIVAINAGGAAVGSFAADEDYTSQGSWTYRVPNAIDTSLITNAAPQTVYQSQRTAANLTYVIPGLTAGTQYTVTLSFAELDKTGPGQRVFNVSINGSLLLSNFDIFATAGAADKAIQESFAATASSTGTITISLSQIPSNPTNVTVNAIEIAPGSASPAPTPTPALNDWPSYAYDIERTSFNPNTTNITPASVPQLHLAWEQVLGGDSSTQPIIASNIAGHAALAIIGNHNIAEAYDALTGALVWKTTLPQQDVGGQCGSGTLGISGTAAYDAALGAVFMAAGDGNPQPTQVILYRLSVATGAVTGQVDVTPTSLTGESNHAHSAVLFANGQIYVGTASDCEGGSVFPMWRGRVASVNPSSMTLLNTFFTTWGHGGNYGGGGLWAWGGVSADSFGFIHAATGNTETATSVGTTAIPAPFTAAPVETAGYGEHLLKLDASLALHSANYPGFDPAGEGDLDYAGTPVVFQPPGCGLLLGTQGKAGQLVINNSSDSSEVNSFAFSVRSVTADYIGNPAYSPVTGYLYAAIASAGAGTSLLPPGLAAITGCGTSIAWNAQFGPDSHLITGQNPRSAPTVTAGGVVFMATPCSPDTSGGCTGTGTVGGALWAVDASTGTVLGGGEPLLITPSEIWMAPSVDGDWVFVIDNSANFYALTVDPAVPAIKRKAGLHVTPRWVYRGN